MSITLRRADPIDAPMISTILSDWIDETPWMPRIHTREQDQGFGAWLIDIMDVTIAQGGDDILGFLARQGSEIHALYLAAWARSLGTGSTLIKDAQRRSPLLSLWSFQDNTRARAFYRRHGFVEDTLTDGQGNDEKLPDVHLSWARTIS